MIEAVNSVIANASLLRGNTEQVDASRAFASNPERVQEVVARSPSAPFVSPYISVDVRFDTAVLQIRDSDTGDVVSQFPSESAMAARQRQAAQAEGRIEAESTSTFETSQAESFLIYEADSIYETGPTSSLESGFEAFSAGSSGSAEAQAASAALVHSALATVQITGNVSVTA